MQEPSSFIHSAWIRNFPDSLVYYALCKPGGAPKLEWVSGVTIIWTSKLGESLL